MSSNEFVKILALTKVALILSGIKTYKSRYVIVEYFMNRCSFISITTVLNICIFGEIYGVVDGVKTGKAFVELSLTSPCITISILYTVKALHIYLNKGTLELVFNKLKVMHPVPTHDVNSNEEIAVKYNTILKESKKLFKSVTILLLIIIIVVFTTFCFVPVLLMWYQYNRTGELKIRYPFLVKYFFDVHTSSWWQLIYFHQVWSTAIVITFMFGCDTLLYALCVFITMHFRLLGLQFQNIVSTSKTETKKNLAKAVMKHQVLIDLVNQTEVLYSKSSLFNILTSSILICLSAFNISVTKDIDTMLAFISFLVLSLSQISLMCYFADMLMRSSMEISGFVFKCPWYKADEDIKKTMLLVMMRSQKACRLTAWSFGDLNLRAFTTILSRSWSYFALLKTVYK